MNKRGSHVGMILSFVVFMSFLIFLFSVLEPVVKTEKDKQFLLSFLGEALENNFSTMLNASLINIDEDFVFGGGSCLKLDNSEGKINGEKLVVKDDVKNNLSYYISGDFFYVEKGVGENEKFFKVYYSEEFASASSVLEGCDEVGENYEVSLLPKKEYIFEGNVLVLLEQHNTDYETLKEDFNVPADSEFGFSFTYENGTIIGTEDKEVQTNIYVNEIPVQYVDEVANISSGFISVKVW